MLYLKVENTLNIFRTFLFQCCSTAGETDKVLNKWDNHNTIARGWAGVGNNYHPVTFRSIYNVETQNAETIQL